MAITPTILETFPLEGNSNLYRGTVALDSSYAGSGGEAFDVAANERFDTLIAYSGGTTATGLGFGFDWDAAAQKLIVKKANVTGTVTLDPSSLLTDAVANNDVTVTGLATTDTVLVVPPITLEAGLVVQSAVVSAADTLRVRIQNVSAGTVNGASATWTWLIPGSHEVFAATDLSALTAVPFLAIGQ
jgi:hypothetical protein